MPPTTTIEREDLKLQQDFEVWSDRDGSEAQVPKNVARVTFQVDGVRQSEATVKNGFLLWYAELTSIEVTGQADLGDLLRREGPASSRGSTRTATTRSWTAAAGDPLRPSTVTGPIFPK